MLAAQRVMRLDWITNQLSLRGMTRRELAEQVGLTEVQMSKALSGQRKLSADEADQIRRVFGYSLPDDLSQTEMGKIIDRLSVLDDRQKRAVTLYLKALLGSE